MDKPSLTSLSKTQERALLAGLILIGWAFIVLARLFILQVVQHDPLARMARHQQERRESIDAPRGTIFDRYGNILAISSNAPVAVVNPKRIPKDKIELGAAMLAGILHQNAEQLQADFERASMARKGGGYLVVENHLTDQQAASLAGLNLDWLEIRQASVRNYPNGPVASHVIGNVDFEGTGKAGVEAKFNGDLTGTSGLRRTQRDGKDVSYESEVLRPPVQGKSLGLTIDREVQFVAQQALKQAVESNHAEYGSLVAMNPRTGEIIALENYPTYDPNERLKAKQDPVGRSNLAVAAPFEPGSVFKVVTVSAALETTSLRPESPIDCENGVMHLGKRAIHDTHKFGILPVQDVLAFSSNIGAIKIAQQIGERTLDRYIRAFGFARKTHIDLPAEHPGALRPLERWKPTSIGSIPMGHEIGVTSVQLAQMGAVIANGGYLVQPHVLAWKQATGGPRETPVYSQPAQVLQPETVMAMRSMMRRVVTEPHGTAHELHLVGYSLAGKTGTAQLVDPATGKYGHRYNASFLGFAPATNPSLVMVVTISGTTVFGATAAGPVFLRVMSTAMNRLGIVRDVPQEVDELIARDKSKAKKDVPLSNEADSDSVADLAEPLTAEELQLLPSSREALTPANPNGPTAPDFVGKTVRDVIQEATARGIEVDMLGDGLARAQTPAAGVVLSPGEHIRVRFAR